MPTNKIQTGLRLNETIYEQVKVISTRELEIPLED